MKTAPRFYLRCKDRESLMARQKGREKPVWHCHLSSRGLFMLRSVTSCTKKQNKRASSWNPVKGRKEREDEEEKVAGTGFCLHLLHQCLQWKHPGVIRWDVTSGFHHGSASCMLFRAHESLRFCSTPTARIWGHSPKVWPKKSCILQTLKRSHNKSSWGLTDARRPGE